MPDHSSFSKNRHGRFRDSDAFRQLFESVGERCITEGLVGGEGFAIDASIIRADANRRRGMSPTQPIDWPARERCSGDRAEGTCPARFNRWLVRIGGRATAR